MHPLLILAVIKPLGAYMKERYHKIDRSSPLKANRSGFLPLQVLLQSQRRLDLNV